MRNSVSIFADIDTPPATAPPVIGDLVNQVLVAAGVACALAVLWFVVQAASCRGEIESEQALWRAGGCAAMLAVVAVAVFAL